MRTDNDHAVHSQSTKSPSALFAALRERFRQARKPDLRGLCERNLVRLESLTYVAGNNSRRRRSSASSAYSLIS